ncbi:Ig-like domain-containing protein [Massilia horti]|uniref:Lamin tail domain-containing protein n=1 Tax=Massilia horti TaxID=2562153 RepID=A0A4Y9T1L2_9BURK|nr:Ig-like domain-containing protein [Massilia horti]TFW32877.1 lamin tail domain-containing protein [Massilia horti]
MNGKNQVGRHGLPRRALVAMALAAINFGALAQDLKQDHREFEATLYAPYAGDTQGSRSFTLDFSYPFVESAQDIFWRLELLDARGNTVQRWHGIERLTDAPRKVNIDWAARSADPSLADGVYTVRMVATAKPTTDTGGDTSAEGVDAVLAAADDAEEQKWDIVVGEPSVAAMPSAATLAAPLPEPNASPRLRAAMAMATATTQPAYTVYFGNLHSQTNHSDGGGNLASCSGAQNPQAGTAGGPAEAFAYAKNRGLDFLMASEHNHMYDGSDGTNTGADAVRARALYQSGLKAAVDFNAANPNFLGIYGLEWGVINNGGHMNIFNTPELLEWEYNSSGELIGDTFTAKGDYAGLYTLMAKRGWVGQFNHPASSGQFLVNGKALGYTADGDTAMALCEVLNTSAFSVNTTETETGRSSYEGACQKALEAGFHVAFSTDQDNHCANWGASYTNRTGILIPTGTPFTNASFIEAIKARRVFATMDKASQLILTSKGNGATVGETHMMGERFTNYGSLSLTANYSNTNGKSASTVTFYEGVPGRNGTVTVLGTGASQAFTPALGEHFYYAKVTQNDGNILWSAPIWVTQVAGAGDLIIPTVSASVSGSSGNITLSANASDDKGVTLVEFYVDGNLIAGTDVTPYTATLDSTKLSNGSHSLVAWAYDAANNIGKSSPVTFTISNTIIDLVPPVVSASVTGSAGRITLNATATDNVGVTKVEFYVDGSLVGSSTTAPYTLAYDSTLLTNGSHSLVTKAYDAANNIGSSSAFAFTIDNTAGTPAPRPAHLVISQIYGAGGNAGASLRNDYIEIFNPTSAPVSLSGLSVQYASSTGTSWSNTTALPAKTLQPGQYFLVAEFSNGAIGSALPTADATGTINLSGTAGKVALVNGTTALPAAATPTSTNVIDWVAFGTGSSPAEGGVPTATLSPTTAAFRTNECVDTDNNGADFTVQAAAPRNTSTPLHSCITNVTASFEVTSVGPVYNRTTQKFSVTYTLTNKTAAAISGPVNVEFAGLTSGVSIDNASGTHNGAQYVTFANGALAPGQTATVTVIFSNPSKGPIGYNAIIYSGTL